MYANTYSSQNAARSYQSVDVQTANPARLIALLFSTMDTRLATAEDLLRRQAPMPECAPVLGRVFEILNELEGALNLEQGGVLAANLLALYRYIRERLQDTLHRLDAVGEARRLIAPLAAAWNELASGPAPVLMSSPRLVA